MAPIARGHDLIDKAAIRRQISKVAASPQQQGIPHHSLDVAVRALDRAVLVGNACIVAGRLHPVMSAQRIISRGQISAGIGIKITERSREAVRPVTPRSTACGPQGVLQPLSQGNKALAAQDHMAVLEPAIGQPEVIEHMLQRHACDRDIEIAHMGEVRQAKPARLMQLPEDDLALGPMQRTPAPDPPLQRPARKRQIAVPTAQLLKDRNRTQPGRCFQQRHNLLVEEPGKRIGTPPPTGRLLLRR